MPITGLHSYQTRLNHLVVEANMRMGSPAAFPGKSLQPLMPQKKKKKTGSKSKKLLVKKSETAENTDLEEQNTKVSPEESAGEDSGEAIRKDVMDQSDIMDGSEQLGAFYRNPDARELARGILWAEILGEPVSRKRRRKRMSQYVNQGYVDRR